MTPSRVRARSRRAATWVAGKSSAERRVAAGEFDRIATDIESAFYASRRLWPRWRRRLVALTPTQILVIQIGRRRDGHSVVARERRRRGRSAPVLEGSKVILKIESEVLHTRRRAFDPVRAAFPPAAIAGGPEGNTKGDVAAGLLAAVSLPVLVVGMRDLLAAQDDFRFSGLLLCAAGALAFAAFVALFFDPWRWERGRSMGRWAAAAIVLIVGLGLLGAKMSGRLVIGGLVGSGAVVLAAGAAWLLLPWPSASSDTTPTGPPAGGVADEAGRPPLRERSLPRSAAAAGLSVSFLVGIAQFWYTNHYLPSRSGASLNITAKLEPLPPPSPSPPLRSFLLDIAVENNGKARVQTISSLYVVKARAVVPSAAATTTTTMSPGATTSTVLRSVALPSRATSAAIGSPGRVADPPQAMRVSTYSTSSDGEVLVEYGNLTDPGWWFEPGERFTRRFVVDLPPHVTPPMNRLDLRVDFVVARGEKLRIQDYQHRSQPFEATESRIQQLSWMRTMLHGREAVYSVLDVSPSGDLGETPGPGGSDELPRYLVCVGQARQLGDEDEPATWCGREDLDRFFGLTSTTTRFEVPLEPLPSTTTTTTTGR